MRTFFTAALALSVAVAGQGQDTKPPAKIQPLPAQPKTEVTLKVGDPAPALKGTKWLQGDEIKEFAKDHVYVVEFWATWCGPCIVMMPHMGELQAQYKGKAIFIGFTAKDPNNTEEKVIAMVSKRGPKLGYTFVYADDRDTYNAWMRAAGRNGIPCCFVVGKDGKIAYIGHPMYLDIVLPKVVASTWTADDLAELDKVETEVNAVFKSFSSPDPQVALDTLAKFEAKYPPLTHIPYFIGPKLSMYLKTKKYSEAKKLAENVVAKATQQDDPAALRTVAGVLSSSDAKEQKELLVLAVQAAETGVKIAGEKDAFALLTAANACYAAGDKSKAAEYGKKALAATEGESPQLKTYIEGQVRQFIE
jgi:thiol-disulfide isomerase/thioredoxin